MQNIHDIILVIFIIALLAFSICLIIWIKYFLKQCYNKEDMIEFANWTDIYYHHDKDIDYHDLDNFNDYKMRVNRHSPTHN